MKDKEERWAKWLRARPKIIQELGEKLKPWKIYKIKKTGQVVSLYSFAEDGTVTVSLRDPYPALGQEGFAVVSTVFGLKPEDLEEIE